MDNVDRRKKTCKNLNKIKKKVRPTNIQESSPIYNDGIRVISIITSKTSDIIIMLISH